MRDGKGNSEVKGSIANFALLPQVHKMHENNFNYFVAKNENINEICECMAKANGTRNKYRRPYW